MIIILVGLTGVPEVFVIAAASGAPVIVVGAVVALADVGDGVGGVGDFVSAGNARVPPVLLAKPNFVHSLVKIVISYLKS